MRLRFVAVVHCVCVWWALDSSHLIYKFLQYYDVPAFYRVMGAFAEHLRASLLYSIHNLHTVRLLVWCFG